MTSTADSISPPAIDLSGLLAPMDVPYGEAEGAARLRVIRKVWARAEADGDIAFELDRLCQRGFWPFFALLCVSKDEKASRDHTLRPAPPLRCYKVLADWLDERRPDGTWAHPVVAIDKSRQLFMSWFVILRLLWIAMYKPFADCPILSKNEDDAKLLIDRVGTAWGLLPAWYRRVRGLKPSPATVSGLYLSNGSRIEALPQRGGDAVRGRTPTAGLADEAAFQSDFEKNLGAILAANDPRSQFISISTANPSHFERVIRDSLDGRGGPGSVTVYHESTGLKLWRNARNGVDCARIHYTADPARRSPEWKAEKMRGMSPHQWRQEQEIDYAARGGKPVFPMLARGAVIMHAAPRVYELGGGRGWAMTVPGLLNADGSPRVRRVTLMRAVDHGTTNYCAAVWVAVDEDLDWTVYRAYKVSGRFAPENARAIGELSGDERYEVDVIDAMQGLPDRRGHVEDLYRSCVLEDGRQPFYRTAAVKKGAGSRQEGLDQIGSMLYASMAIELPEAEYWRTEGYGAKQIEAFRAGSALFVAPGAEALFQEMDEARYDERPGGDPTMAQPETSVDMMDDLLDCLRYIIRSAGDRWVRRGV